MATDFVLVLDLLKLSARVCLLTHHSYSFQGNYLEVSCGLLTGAGPQPMGKLHDMERWEAGTEALSEPELSQSEEGRHRATGLACHHVNGVIPV